MGCTVSLCSRWSGTNASAGRRYISSCGHIGLCNVRAHTQLVSHLKAALHKHAELPQRHVCIVTGVGAENFFWCCPFCSFAFLAAGIAPVGWRHLASQLSRI